MRRKIYDRIKDWLEGSEPSMIIKQPCHKYSAMLLKDIFDRWEFDVKAVCKDGKTIIIYR